MSMGPEKVEEQFSVSTVEKARIVVKSVSIAFFADPLHYIFYLALLLLVVGLFIGKTFSYEFYAVIIILAAVKLVRFYTNKTADGAQKNG